MKTTKLIGVSAVVLAMVSLVVIPRPMAAQDQEGSRKQVHYSVQKLGTLGGTSSSGNGINNKDWVTGTANLQGDRYFHAFLWRKGVMTDLGTFGGNSFVGWAPNERGEIAGYSETSTQDPLGEDFCGNGTGLVCRGFVWQDGVMTPLSTLGGNNGAATQNNNLGQVAGFAENSTKDPACISPQARDYGAVVWGPKKGEIQELPPLTGDSIAAATSINDRGQVVGGSGSCGPPQSSSIHAVLWQNGSVTDLGGLGGAVNNLAYDINNRGQAVGFSDLPGDKTFHAFLWDNDSGMQDLGTLPGDTMSLANYINDVGQIVGTSCDSSGCRAFVWQDGVMTDLNALIPPGSPLQLIGAGSINSRGEIVGQAFDQSTGDTPAFLAIPCDNPQADNRGCDAEKTIDTERPKVTLPEKVREQLRRRRGFVRFGVGPVGAQ